MSVSALVRARDALAGIGALLAALEDECIACAFGERLAPDLSPPVSLRAALREWWRGAHAHRSALRARLDPRRGAMVAGKWVAPR